MENKKNKSLINYRLIQTNTKNSKKAGFTLIEVLVSLALLTIILGAVYGSFFTVHRAIDRFDGISLKYHEARTVLDTMRREIEGGILKNPQSPDPDGINKTAFIITDRDIFGKPASRLNLTAFSFKSAGIYTISYYAEKKDNTINLIKTEMPLITGQIKVLSGNAQTMEIMEGIEGFTVEALYEGRWIKTWDTSRIQNLPDIVKLSIEFDDKGDKVKLVEYARPKVGKIL